MSTSPSPTAPTEHRNLHNGQGKESPKLDEVFPSIRGAWEAILFYGGIPTLTVYPLGLATLYLYQKSIRTYNHTDAWYAISLIPKTTVLGVGAEVLLRSLTYTLVSGLLAANLFFLLSVLGILAPRAAKAKLARPHSEKVKKFEKTWRKLVDPYRVAGPHLEKVMNIMGTWRKRLAIVLTIVLPILTLFLTKLFVFGNLGRVWYPVVFGIPLPVSVWYPAIGSGFVGATLLVSDYRKKREREQSDTVWYPAIGSGSVEAMLSASDYRKKREREQSDTENRNAASKVHHWRWMLRGLTVVYVGALLSALLAAAYPTDNPDSTYQTIDLKLPKAVLDTGKETTCTVEEPCPLLSHSDGYWNIITPQKNDILSVPDDEVTDSKVRVLLGSEESTPGGN